MSLFKRKNQPNVASANNNLLAEIALMNIHDGVIITDRNGVIEFINPAAVRMTDCGGAENAIGLDYGLIFKIESKERRELSENENLLTQAMKTNQNLDRYEACLTSKVSDKCIPVAISVIIANNHQSSHIITFRDITKELAEDSEQAEFISTASHEMRTPVASIEGFLSLALNPQTATIDDRARNYLTSAHEASKHLGHLFQDLLDVTKLDDGRARPHFEPVEMVGLVKQIADGYAVAAKEANISYRFGSENTTALDNVGRIDQVVYGYVDINFMREIMGNLIDNAIKYTPSGGSIYINVLGDGDRVLINVTDTGIGISSDDIHHIFQKFYRADNSDTRTIGGTGLGLYLVKQRTEAMGGRVWAESAFSEGSTFYVSLPRLTNEEYEKRMIAVRNQNIANQPPANTALAQATPVQQPPAQYPPTPSQPPLSAPPQTSNVQPINQTTNINLNGEIK